MKDFRVKKTDLNLGLHYIYKKTSKQYHQISHCVILFVNENELILVLLVRLSFRFCNYQMNAK